MLSNTTDPATLHISRKLLVLALTIALGATLAVTAQGQTAPVSQGPATQASTQPPIPFEVISIRKSKAEFLSGNGFTADGFEVRGTWASMLIALAYGFGDYSRMPGMPRWCFEDKFDIQAKVDEADVDKWNKLDVKTKKLALQALLASRFHLKAHFETRQGKIYELVIAKGGPKFKAADPKDMLPSGSGANLGKAMTLDSLATSLTGGSVSRPVVNKTGLSGLYNLSYSLVPDDDSSDPKNPITEQLVLRSIREQLGLDLRPAEGPINSLIIDHVEQPTEN